jgi:para-nitrobenzyl esterase
MGFVFWSTKYLASMRRRAVVITLGVVLGACGGEATGADAGSSSETGDGDGDPGDGDGDLGDGDGDPGEISCEEDPNQLTIYTAHGPVSGLALEAVTRFAAIPYAAPPVGELRLAPPQPPTPWVEPRDGTELGPKCIQLAVSGDDPTTEGSEDCLHLNIWTPDACTGADHPVMVFIHGGGNAIGSGVDPIYDGSKLAAAQQAVVVTLNYRLGALGWLTHPALDGESPGEVSGNYGLRDQIAALAWVRDNIRRFGGDPDRVLVFGQSAGGVNTCAVVGSPLADGLYSSSLVQSGSCRQPSRADLDELSTELVANLGCPEQDPLPCLREKPAGEIMFTSPNGYPSVAGLARGWGPHVDGVVLPQTTLARLEAGWTLPFVVGTTRDETAADSPQNLSEADYQGLVEAAFLGLAPMVLATYPAADYPSPSAAWWSLTADLKFICNARRAAVAARSGGAPTWRYQFSFDDYTTLTPNAPTFAFHGLELVYLFANFDALVEGVEYPASQAELDLSLALQQAWSEFATIGGFPGPIYEVGPDPYLELDVPGSQGMGLRSEQCDFWDQWLP